MSETSTSDSETSTVISQSKISQLKMSHPDRLIRRNVHVYDFERPTDVLGGFCVVQEITHISFYAMLDIFVTNTDTTSLDNGGFYYLQDSSGVKVERDEQLLQPGDYYMIAAGELLRNHLVHILQAR